MATVGFANPSSSAT